MASHNISIACLAALFFLSFHSGTCHAARILLNKPTASNDFILSSCKSTTYPSLCYSSLSSYASTIQTSPMQLAHTALSVSMDAVRSTSAVMKRMSAGGAGSMTPRQAAAVKDCVENMGDSMYELQESLGAMGHLGGKDMGYQLNSIQTWVSAALTGENTCTDGFEGTAMNGGVKDAVRDQVVNVAQMTSNALALINALARSSSP